MDKNELSEARADIIDRFINLEWIINAIISQHYFGEVHEHFIFDVLNDEYFSFGFKRRIIEKIIADKEKKQIQNLNRLNTIRNYFVHNNPVIFFKDSDGEKVGIEPDPRVPSKMRKAIDYDTMYKEFKNLEFDVAKFLFEIYKELDGKFFDD